MQDVTQGVGPDGEAVQAYNYAHYLGEDALPFRAAASVGTHAPDALIELLQTGQQVALSSLWQEQDLLIEFGSIT